MWIKDWMRYFIAISRSPLVQVLLLAAYYFLIIVALVALYGQGDFSATEFVYQGF